MLEKIPPLIRLPLPTQPNALGCLLVIFDWPTWQFSASFKTMTTSKRS
jgi:hypothetical protein